MSELEQELARLRAENEALKAAQAPVNAEHKARLDRGLMDLAASARKEANQYAAIQQQGLDAPVGEITPTSLEAARRVMIDMGLA